MVHFPSKERLSFLGALAFRDVNRNPAYSNKTVALIYRCCSRPKAPPLFAVGSPNTKFSFIRMWSQASFGPQLAQPIPISRINQRSDAFRGYLEASCIHAKNAAMSLVPHTVS